MAGSGNRWPLRPFYDSLKIKGDRKYKIKVRQENAPKHVIFVAAVSSGWKGYRTLVKERVCAKTTRQLGKNWKLI